MKAVLFVSQAPEVSRRYRTHYQAEQLELMGATADVTVHGEVHLMEAVDRYGSFVLHRVPWGPDVEEFIEGARARGRTVVFDTDDLTFDPEAARYVAALDDMDAEERDLYVDGLRRYRETLLHADAVTVSTEPLRLLAEALHDHVVVLPNVVGEDAVAAADEVLRSLRPRPDGTVTFAYFSGTPTHSRDFAVAQEALLEILDSHPGTRLLVVGALTLDTRFDAFRERVVRFPLQPWKKLPELVARADVNLAPLESDNPFTECKSSIKFVEAGLVTVPTVASPRPDFVRSVEHGRSGLLAETAEEWRQALRSLAADAELRRAVGAAAREEVRRHHTTRAGAPGTFETIRSIAEREEAEPLTVNWMMLAPIAQNSGGYRNIFRIADYLAERGHTVRLCVEPVAHLEGLSDAEIEAFVGEAFGPLRGEVVVGSWNAPPADVSVATHWPTAFTLAESQHSFFRAYYIQDFEPEFYEESDPRYAEAARTYALPLRHICLGRHLADRLTEHAGTPAEWIDFALDPQFRLERDTARRGDRLRGVLPPGATCCQSRVRTTRVAPLACVR